MNITHHRFFQDTGIKGKHVSIEEVVKYEGEVFINYQAGPDQNKQLLRDCTVFQ